MKKGENTRSHSWWWDSHINPKNSKWLQDNLSEMDTKVNAMLKIIEEDADSFAQRAEMYYKKRPELINLVEEFYRTYRALVERYTFLTREIRQNMAPALQAQLGVSSESAQNSPVDLHLKRGGLDGPDIISPSYSYAGASEFDCDSPFSARGPVDEDELSPSGFGTYGFMPKFSSPDVSTPKASESRQLHGTLDALQKDVFRLQDENRALTAKSSEDATRLKSLQLELSGLQAKFRSLEADDKLNKKRLKSVQDQEKRLEAENLRLSHALITSKEERTELAEQHSKVVEESKVASQNNRLLEDEMVALRDRMHAAQVQALERLHKVNEAEEATQKLQQALTALEEQRSMDALQLSTYERQSHDLHSNILEAEEEQARLKEEILAQEGVVKTLEAQLMDLKADKAGLEQLLLECKEELKALKHEREESSSKMAMLQRELEKVCNARESLSDQVVQQTAEIARLKEALAKFEEEKTRLEIEKLEASKYLHKLEADIEEGRKVMETLKASHQQEEERCKALQSARSQLEEELISRNEETTRLGKQIATLEVVAVDARLQIKELEKRVSSLAGEKTVLTEELELASERIQVVERECLQMHEVEKGKQEKVKDLERRCMTLSADIERLEASLLHFVEERSGLVKRESETLQAHQRLEAEHRQLRQDLEKKLSLTRDLEDKLSQMENEKNEMALEMHQLQQSIAGLTEQITSLNSQLFRSKADQEGAEEAAKKAQRELGDHVSEREQLQEEMHAKAEQICELRNHTESLEAQLAQLMEEKSLLTGEIEEYMRKLASVDTQTHALSTSLSNSLSKVAALSEQSYEKDKKIDLLSSELSTSNSQVVALNEELTAQTNHVLSLQDQLHALQEQVGRLHEEAQKSSETIQSLERVVDRLQQQVFEGDKANHLIVQEKQRVLDELLVMKEASRGLETDLINLREERELLLQKASAEYKNMEQRIKGLEGEFEATRSESEALREQLAKCEEEKKTLEEENTSCSRKLFETEGRIQDLQLRISKLLVEKVALTDEVSEKMKALHTKEAELLDMERDKAVLGEEVHLLKQQVHTLEGMEASLLADLHTSSELNQNLRVEIKALQQQVSLAAEVHEGLAQKSLDESLVLKRQIEDLQASSSLLIKEKSLLTRDMASHSAWSKELEVKVERSEDEKASLQQDLSSALEVREKLNEDLKASNEEKDQLSQALDSCKKEMKKQEEELENLQQALSHVKEEHGATVDNMNLLMEEKEALERAHLALLAEHRESKDEAERARSNLLNLETGLSHLQQMNATFATELYEKIQAVKALHEEISSLQGTKDELEEKLQVSSTQLAAHEAEAKALQEILASAQHENRRLRVVSVAEEEAAQGRIIDTSEDCSKRKETSHVLKQEVAAVISVKAKLEEELASLQEEQTVDKQKMESMQREMITLQEQQTQALADLNAAEKRLQEEIAHLKALGLQEISNLQVSVAKLETEVCWLQAERKALEEDKALTTSQMLNLQQEMEVLRLQLSQKEGLVLSSTAQLDRLQRDFSSTETEMASLKEAAQKDRESFGAAKEALKAELHICEQEVVSKGAEISDLTTTLHGLEQSNKMLMEDKALTTAQILDLQQQIEVLRLQLLEKEELVLSLSAQVDQLQRAFSSTETEMAGLKEAAQKDSESFGAAEEALKAELLVCQREVAFKGAKISELTTSLHGLEQSNKMLLEEKALTRAQMLDLQQQVQALQLQLSEKEELALTLSVEVDHLQRAFSSTETEMAGLKGVAQKERESFGAAEEALKAELLVCQREVASKGAEISELTTSLHGLERSNKMLMEDKTLTTAQMLDLQQQMKVLRLELLEEEELALSLAVQVDRLERAFSSAETEMVSLREIAQKDREFFGAAEEALKAELLFRQREVASKGAEILELTTTLHGLEQSNEMLMEEMSAKELLHLQAQEGAKVLMEENMELTHRLQIGSADLLQSREEGEALAAELHELRDRLLKLQSLHDDIEAANQAQAEEKSLLAKQIKESTSALSELQEENAVLRVNLAVKSTALIDAQQDILLLKEQFAEPDDRFGLHEGHATRSIQINDEAEETTRQADMDKLDLLEKELAAARGDNGKLRDMISAGATAVTELQEETAKLHVRNQNLQEESELVHTEVKRLKGELSNVQKRAECLDAERMGLKEQLEDARSTHSMLLDLQGKSLAYSLLLKENLVSSCKGIKAIAEELQKFVSEKRANQIMEGVEKLSTLQNLSDGQGIVGKKKMHSAGESSLEEVAMKSLQHKGSWPNVSKDFVLEQLNRRVEEMDLLHDAVGTMMPPFDSLPSMDQNAALQSTIPQVPKEVACESEIDEHHDPLLIQGQQLPIFASMAEEHDTEEMSSTDDTSSVEGEIARKLVPQEYEALEMGALDHNEQIQLMQGLARLHINLGMRLHQAMMDEKLELELLELKEERKRLQEDLQARVEQVQRMESELEKLQALLKEGSEKDEKMRKVERRARRLSEELVLRRQQVGNMQEVVMSWAQQQEMATEKLEEQVLSLVSTESAPTMEGWDAEQVNLLMKDMQMRKALTRRHSLELQSVGQELQKVGSSIESTQRQLIYKEEQDGEDDDAVAFDAVTKHGKPRQLGLAWFRLLLSKERKGLLRRSRSKRSLAIPALTTRVSSSTSASSTSMSTWLAQTKRLGCCACGLAPHRSKSLDDKERSS